jgi:hypothetical protein
VAGLSAFGSFESGTFGARTGPLADVVLPPDTTAAADTAAVADSVAVEPLFRISDRKATRFGAQFAWKGIVLSGAKLRLETDSLLPLGIQPDRGQPALAGGVSTGWEATASLPLPIWDGFHVQGSYQQWDSASAGSYMPRRVYTGALVYHKVFMASHNFEWWWSVGVVGHDPMSVRQVVGDATDEQGNVVGPELATVPFYQNWYGRLQIRIVTVQLFIGWDNFAVRRELQDYPDRFQPLTRAYYGLRWTMWN